MVRLLFKLFGGGLLAISTVSCGSSGKPGIPTVESAFDSVPLGETAEGFSRDFPYRVHAVRRDEDLRSARSVSTHGKVVGPSGLLVLMGASSEHWNPSMRFEMGVSVSEVWALGDDPRLATLRGHYRKWMALDRVLSLLPKGVDARFRRDGVDVLDCDLGKEGRKLKGFSGRVSYIAVDATGTSYHYDFSLQGGVVVSKDRLSFTY